MHILLVVIEAMFLNLTTIYLHTTIWDSRIIRIYHIEIKGISNKFYKIQVHSMHHRDFKVMEFLTLVFKGKSALRLLKTLLYYY